MTGSDVVSMRAFDAAAKLAALQLIAELETLLPDDDVRFIGSQALDCRE